jgi:hypothetical protein
MSRLEAWEWEATVVDPGRRIDHALINCFPSVGSTLVELDCGTGIYASRWAEFAGWVVGVERDREFLRAAKRRFRASGRDNVRAVSSRDFRTFLPPASADGVILRVRPDLMGFPGRFPWLDEARRLSRGWTAVIEPSTEEGGLARCWGIDPAIATLRDEMYRRWGYEKVIVETNWHAPGRFVMRRLLATLPNISAEDVIRLGQTTSVECAYNIYRKPPE